MNFFGIDDGAFLDPNKIKILDGIAGSAKSTNCDTILRKAGVSYGRYTSTNKLRRDAIDRFGGHVETIAGGLFVTTDGKFYADEKDIDMDCVVIDEILQADPRIFGWIASRVGVVNIIVCTDSKQLLTPMIGEYMLKTFTEFCKRDDVIHVQLTKSFRPRTEETAEAFIECFRANSEGFDLFEKYKKAHKVHGILDLEYNYNDIFLTHTNNAEKLLYNLFNLSQDYNAPLIPKGTIARNGVNDPEKYAIVPQANITRQSKGYFQIANIATPTRYQGSEVKSDQKLFYIFNKDARVSNREWYTVLTRCWDIKSIVLVECDCEKVVPLESYNNIPILARYTPTVKKNDELDAIIGHNDSKKIELSDEELKPFMQARTNLPGYYNIPERCYYDGRLIVKKRPESTQKRKSTCGSLLGKEPDLSYGDILPDFLRAYEKTQREAELTVTGVLRSANIRDEKNKKLYKYAIDFCGSYPTILSREWMPTGALFVSDDDKSHTFTSVPEVPGYIDFYISVGNGFISDGSIVAGDLVRYAQSQTYSAFYYIGSCTAKHGTRIGATVYEKYHKNVESKQKCKGDMHWGYIEKPYLQAVEWEKLKPTAYIINESQDKQLLMLAIKSKQAENLLRIQHLIYRDFGKGATVADCLYFDTDRNIAELGEEIAAMLPGYEFRISENEKDGKILYKNYADLLTKKEQNAKRMRESRAKRSAQKCKDVL